MDNPLVLKGWYEIRDQKLFIWEGILASFPASFPILSVQLFKVMDGEIFECHVDLSNSPDIEIREVTSDGYWECAEISGVLSNGRMFLCHSIGVEHAGKVLKVLPSAITNITIRLDPDPLRNWHQSKINDRIESWKAVMKSFCEFPENSNIVLDSEMLS